MCNFNEQINKVRYCGESACNLNILVQSKKIEPIQLSHDNPDEVRIIIVTEQPKILKGKEVTNDNFWDAVSDTSTLKELEKILGKSFSDSIKNRTGSFYWTHHTKCPSKKRLPQDHCANAYLESELRTFKNVRLVISFGSKSFKFITQNISEDANAKLTKYFYDTISGNVINQGKTEGKKYIFPDNKSVVYLALPHPSKANPLAALISEIKVLINAYIERALK